VESVPSSSAENVGELSPRTCDFLVLAQAQAIANSASAAMACQEIRVQYDSGRQMVIEATDSAALANSYRPGVYSGPPHRFAK